MTTPTGASDSPAPTRFAAVLDDLVAGSRSARDGVFNTLDAVSRQTEAASAQLAAEATRLVDERRATEQAADSRDEAPERPAERDTRFDPEDDWELPPVPEAMRNGAAAGNAPRSPHTDSDTDNNSDDSDDDSGQQTWLR